LILNFKKERKMLNWDFPELAPKDQRGKTIAMNNFRGETKNFAEIFVRELMQNFLDARGTKNQGSIPRITIRLINDSTGLDASYNKQILKNLIPHLKASYQEVKKQPNNLDFAKPEALVIEEHYTCGLTGKTNKSGAKGKDERWANFWFGEGKASKKGSELGRAGEGKITYNMASLANSLIAISTRDGEKKGHLFGKCIFPSTYEVAGVEYGRNCYWGLNDDSDPEQPIPTSDNEELENFKNAYCLERDLDQPGTSWVIPFPQIALSKESLIKALLKDFFFTIYSSKKVEIEICGEKITESNLIGLAKKYLAGEEPSIDFLIFLEHVHASEPEDLYHAKMDWWKDKTLNEGSFRDNKYDEIKKKFDLGQHVGVKFPVKVYPKERESLCSFITVWIQKRQQASCEHIYVRGDLIISDEKPLNKREPVFAVMIAEDEEISNFLANAEVASHLRWNREEDTLSENYNDRYETIKNVRVALPQLFFMLKGSQEKRVEDLLVDILSIPDSSGQKKKSKKTSGKGKKKQDEKKILLPSKPKFLNIDDGQGIRIKPGPAAKVGDVSYPVTGKIKVAYERQAGFGDPFSNYHPFDFDLAEFKEEQFKCENLNILSRNENLIEYEITDKDFYLEITGFSSKQQVRAKVGVNTE